MESKSSRPICLPPDQETSHPVRDDADAVQILVEYLVNRPHERFPESMTHGLAAGHSLEKGLSPRGFRDSILASRPSLSATISATLVGAFVRKGRARTAWIGFAVFGWAYLLIDLLPPRASGGLGFGPLPWPPRLIEWGFARLQPYLRPVPPTQSSGGYLTPYEQVGHSLGIISFGLIGAVLARLLASKEERPNP
jgi:hypothetical protein